MSTATQPLYYVHLNGQEAGPYTICQLRAMWQSGAVNAATQYWFQGAASWQPLTNLRPMLETAATPTRQQQPRSLPTRQKQNDAGLSVGGQFRFGVIFFIIPGVCVLLSSILYYVWRESTPTKAKQINRLGWTVCFLQILLVAVFAINRPDIVTERLQFLSGARRVEVLQDKTKTQPDHIQLSGDRRVEASQDKANTQPDHIQLSGDRRVDALKDRESKVGPPDEIIIKGAKVLSGQLSPPRIIKGPFRRGTTLVARNIKGVPSGTPIYPIMFDDWQYPVHFFKDEFGDWIYSIDITNQLPSLIPIK